MASIPQAVIVGMTEEVEGLNPKSCIHLLFPAGDHVRIGAENPGACPANTRKIIRLLPPGYGRHAAGASSPLR